MDTLWIESMNTVMDDNKMLTLLNSERIALPPQVTLLYEAGMLNTRGGLICFNPFIFHQKHAQKHTHTKHV